MSSLQLATPSKPDELDQLKFMIAQFAEAYPRTLKPRDPREFALKVKDQKLTSNKENAAPAPRLSCYLFAAAPGESLVGYVALSEPRVCGTPPTLKQIFVRKPERGKGLATAALRHLPFRYEADRLLVEQPVKATHLALQSAGWRLVQQDAQSWLYCRGAIAKNLPKVDLDTAWEWIESEASGGSWASALPCSLAFYPAIVSRDSLERAVGEEGVLALLGMCTGRETSPLFELYDVTRMLECSPTDISQAVLQPEPSNDAMQQSIEGAITVDARPTDAEAATPLRRVAARVNRMVDVGTRGHDEALTPVVDERHASRRRKHETQSHSDITKHSGEFEAAHGSETGLLTMLSHMHQRTPLLTISNNTAPPGIEDTIAAGSLPTVDMRPTPTPAANRMDLLGQDEGISPPTAENHRPRKRKRQTESRPSTSELGAIHQTEEGLLGMLPERLSLGKHDIHGKPRFMDMELRVVQADFLSIDLKPESLGMRVVGLSTQSISGIQADDLITKVDGVSMHSRTRRRPPFCDGMAITVRRQVR